MKKKIIVFILKCTIVFIVISCSNNSSLPVLLEEDPLPSWNNGDTKRSIIDFISKIKQEHTQYYIPEEDRIAVFDDNGTLVAEKPVIQFLFISYRINEMIQKDPSLLQRQPFRAIVDNDENYIRNFTNKELIYLLTYTCSNITEEEFIKAVKDFLQTARPPQFNTSIFQMRYQPQLELINYLKKNKFKVFICTDGIIDFTRVISMPFYNIPSENVIGSTFSYIYKDTLSKDYIYISPDIISINNGEEKPANIYRAIGKRPVFACGSTSVDDFYMLYYSKGSGYPSFQMLIKHDDKEREFAYPNEMNVMLDAAKEHNWTVVSIKDDWKVVFSEK